MVFPIKYNSKERLEFFAKSAHTARALAEQRGENYNGQIAKPTDENLILEFQDLEVGRRWMEGECMGLQQFMDSYQTTNKLIVLCRKFVYPEYNGVHFKDSSGQMPVKDLFFQLGLEEDKLKEVYEFDNNSLSYTGRFAKNGKQRLVDILGKVTVFYKQVSSDPIGVDPETFRPTR